MLLSGNKMQLVVDTIENLKSKAVRANLTEDEKVLNNILELLNITFEEKELRDDWKIFLCAGTQVASDAIKKVIKDYGFNGRVEMELDYKKISGISFDKFRDSQTYKYIIFGQGPHKAKGIGKYGSAISRMLQEQEHYPTVIVLTDSQGKPHLSITELDKAMQHIFINSD